MNLSTLKPYEPGRDPLAGYVTRDGRKVRILATDLNGIASIAAAVDYDGQSAVFSYHETGRMLFNEEHELDLMCAPVQRTMWVNVYQSGVRCIYYETRESADSAASSHRIACIPVTFTEGEGL